MKHLKLPRRIVATILLLQLVVVVVQSQKRGPLTQSEAVELAERFIEQNGYTDLPPVGKVANLDGQLCSATNIRAIHGCNQTDVPSRTKRNCLTKRSNITHYTLFPGLDGLARSMGFEAEYNWAFDPRTMKRKPE